MMAAHAHAQAAAAEKPRTASAEVEQKATLLADQPLSDRWKSWWIRIAWSLVLVITFIVIICMGHLYLTLLVLGLELGSFTEVNNIAFKVNKAREEQLKEGGVQAGSIPLFRTIGLYVLLFSLSVPFMCGSSLLALYVSSFLSVCVSAHVYVRQR